MLDFWCDACIVDNTQVGGYVNDFLYGLPDLSNVERWYIAVAPVCLEYPRQLPALQTEE